QLYATGEVDRLKELLAKQLEACGWVDDVRERCKEYIKKRGRENVTIEDVVRAVRPEGRASVPDSLKAQLLAQIKAIIFSL
ncbi:transcription factor e(y)2-domain-containing protein, partial [Haematococcus lacustris]